MSYYFSKVVDLPFDRAVERVTEVLQTQGFGVLTQIDVAAANPPGVPGYRPLRIQVLDSGIARLCDPAAGDDDPQACL